MKDGKDLHELTEKIKAASKKEKFTAWDVFKNLKKAIEDLIKFYNGMKKAINTQDAVTMKAEAKKKAAKGAILSTGVKTSLVVAKDVKAMFREDQAWSGSKAPFGLKWSIEDDILKAPDSPAPVLLSQGLLGRTPDDVKAVQYFKDQCGWLQDLLINGEKHMQSASIVNAGAKTKIKNTLKKLAAEVQPITLGKTNSQLSDIYDPCFFGINKDGCHLYFSTDYDLLELRMCLTGTFRMMGVPFQCLAGQTLNQKLDNVSIMNSATFLQLATSHGFFVEMKADMALLVPPGYATVFCNQSKDDYCHGIK